MSNTRRYKAILASEEDGGYSVSVPGLPGTFTQGDTIEEALAMAKEAAELMADVMMDDGEPLPDDCEILIEEIEIDLDRLKTAA